MSTSAEEVVKPVAAKETEATATKHKPKKEKQPEDLLVSLVQEVGKLTALEAIAAIPALLESADENYFRLGGHLSVIQSEKFYTAAGYETFRTFVEAEFGLAYRKAMYWIQIYDKLIESGVPWAKVKTVGWTKLKDLALILTVENADEWVERALSSTVLQLQAAIASAKAGTLPNSGITPEGPKSEVTTFTVKVHTDQKLTIKEAIQKARVEANTEYDGVALEGICQNYLSGGNVNKPASLQSVIEKYSPEEVLAVLEKVFTDFVITAKLKTK
jgi:hypothetical protein